jgi:large subunit ribosomal protein L32e
MHVVFMVSKREHPKFRRPNFGRTSRSRIKIAWRRPRGIDNKKRLKIAYMGASPSIGYGQPSAIKYSHPQGMKEKLVQSPSELAGLSGVVVRIASGVGALKRQAIQKIAEQMKLRVVNPKKFVPKVPKQKEKKDEKKKEEPKAAAQSASAAEAKQAAAQQPSEKPASAPPAAAKKDEKSASPAKQ